MEFYRFWSIYYTCLNTSLTFKHWQKISFCFILVWFGFAFGLLRLPYTKIVEGYTLNQQIFCTSQPFLSNQAQVYGLIRGDIWYEQQQ